MSVNKLFAAGRLTADPVLSESANNITMCHFTLACSTRRKDASGQTMTNFYRCTAWRGVAENCAHFLHKGDKVSIVGEPVFREYVDRNGQTRANIEVDISDIEFPPAARTAAPDAPGSFESDELPI